VRYAPTVSSANARCSCGVTARTSIGPTMPDMCDSSVASGQAREMNDPEDRPTTNDRPAPYGDPPDARGGPPVERVEPVAPVESHGAPNPTREAEASREVVVDPMPVAEPDPEPPAQSWPEPAVARSAPTAGPRREATAVDLADGEEDDEYVDYADGATARWVSLRATIGTALIGIVSVQVLASLVEGLTLKSEQRVGVPDDLFHRLGYPFGGLGATALVFLVLGVVLVSLPSVLDELLSEPQDRVVGAALIVAAIMGVLIAVGSLLAVRANLHEYAAKNVPVPTHVRVQFTNFLLGSLGAAALALYGSIASINERGRERI
jgi:hypothetical protein